MDEDVIFDSLEPKKWASKAVDISSSLIVARKQNNPPAFPHQFQSSFMTT